MEASWTYYGKPGAQTSFYWECSFNAEAWALEEKLAKIDFFGVKFGSWRTASGYLGINAGALGAVGGYKGG